jgi:hypothetical protein
MNRSATILFAAGFVWAAGCGGGSSSNGGGVGTGSITVSVSPTATSVVVKQSVAFTATVTGTTNTAVTWEVSGIQGGNSSVGTIDATGVYTAPASVPNPSTIVIAAVSQADPTRMGSGRVQVFQANSNQVLQPLPIQLGTSGGAIDDKSGIYCCSGTLGSLLVRNGTYYILSNNHVLANSDQASLGDPVVQPGLIETHCSISGTQTVANLTAFINLESGGGNVDAAIAQIIPGAVDTSGSILSLGATANGNTPDAGPPHQGMGILATIGENVAKSGRTSGLTCSTVSATNLSVSVTYQKQCNGGSSFNVSYTNQIAISGSGFTIPGDSGSLIVDQNTADPVALLYGGSDTEAVGNPVADVLAAFTDQQGNQASFVGSVSTHEVIGCKLTTAAVKAVALPAQAELAVQTSSLTEAQNALDIHAPELLANPYIRAVGVAASLDRPGDAAVLIVVNPDQEPAPLPATIEGIGTRIVKASGMAPQGILEYEAAQRVAPGAEVFWVSALSKSEMERAKLVHAAHASELMKEPGVQGVGITASADAPGEAALMIYLIRGEGRPTIPAVIDGLRTRVRATSRFTAGQRGLQHSQGCRVQRSAASPVSRIAEQTAH